MKTKTNMPELSLQVETSEQLKLRSQDWESMEAAFIDAEEFQKLEFGDFEMRFVPMADQSYSLLLSKNGIDVFHFMWTEVEGLTDITHRIVNPEFRGQGIGSQVMQMIMNRLQKKADAHQKAVHLMMETSQLSVVGLGLRSGMQLTKGKEAYEELVNKSQKFHMDPETTKVVDSNNYAQLFRLSRVLKPEPKLLRSYQQYTRNNIFQVFTAKAA